MIIDFHTHFYPEKVAPKAIEVCAGKIDAYSDGTRAGLEKSMCVAGIDLSVALTVVNAPENSASINAWAIRENRMPIISTGGIHPDEPDPLATLEAINAAGLPGIKLHPEYQRFKFDEERLFPVWERCEELGLFVVTHVGYDAMYEPPYLSDPEKLAEFHRRFPGLQLVLAHLGGMAMWDEVEKYLVGLPVYLDLAMATKEYITPGQLTRIIKNHGANRILFGSDSPWYDQTRQLKFIRSLPLTNEEQELIFYQNAAELLKI
ncbi:MAG: amidohydrolase family protein [Victivallales bacterium]|jgi:predicted TIM-barrel fold metal-dependent hydrolase|nr:amidohydrolase family protein [Victivallales bacterium]